MDVSQTTHQNDSSTILRPIPRRPYITSDFSSSPCLFPSASPHIAASQQQLGSPDLSYSLRESYEIHPCEVSPSTTVAHAIAPSTFLSQQQKDLARSRSFASLTGSTLLGIYNHTALGEPNGCNTPTSWTTGTQTPAHHHRLDGPGSTDVSCVTRALPDADEPARCLQKQRSPQAQAVEATTGRPDLPVRKTISSRQSLLSVLLCNYILFAIGMSYGAIVARLQASNRQLVLAFSPSAISATLTGAHLLYLMTWGIAGLFIGNLLPFLDRNTAFTEAHTIGKKAVAWIDMTRGIGSFVGVAFAIVSPDSISVLRERIYSCVLTTSKRRLPWTSTLQLGLTLALANPLLWCLLDHTRAGLLLSTLVGFFGAILLLLTNPYMIPAPTLRSLSSPSSASLSSPASASFSLLEAIHNISTSGSAADANNRPAGQICCEPHELIAQATWIFSVLFCSCVCFGNIGRLLVSSRKRATSSQMESGSSSNSSRTSSSTSSSTSIVCHRI